MDYYGEFPRKRRLFPIVLLCLVCALIGGVLSLYLFPLVYGPAYLRPAEPRTPLNFSQEAPKVQGSVDYGPIVAIAEQVGPAIVGISNMGRSSSFFGSTELVEMGSGSGVIISADGYIVTNNHVIRGAERIIARLADNRQMEAQLVGADPDTDLAVLKVSGENLPVAHLGDSNQLRVGELVVAIGNPLGYELARSVTMGVVSAKERSIMIQDRKFKLIQTDAAINPGNSGGALVNSQGYVIGINTVKLVEEGVEGIGFAIPISDAKPIIEELVAQGYISRPSLGIWGITIDKYTAQSNNLPRGIYVDEIILGGAAHKSDLRKEDIIIRLNQTKIESFDDLNSILKDYKPGQKVTLTVYRKGREVSVPLTLGERRSTP